MEKKISIISLIFILSFNFNLFSQNSDFQRGFKEGFVKGFCQDDTNCSPPLIPNSPTPISGKTNYQDGFSIGVKQGSELRENNSQVKIESNFNRAPNNNNNNLNNSRVYNSQVTNLRNTYNYENRGFGISIGYNDGIAGGLDLFLDNTVVGLHFGSRTLEDTSEVLATETTIAGTIGFKILNSLYIKGGIGTYYDEIPMTGFLDYDPSIYEKYSNNGSTFYKIGIQGFFRQNKSALIPEIYYSNNAGIGIGIGFAF